MRRRDKGRTSLSWWCISRSRQISVGGYTYYVRTNPFRDYMRTYYKCNLPNGFCTDLWYMDSLSSLARCFFTLSSLSILDTPKIRVVEYRIDGTMRILSYLVFSPHYSPSHNILPCAQALVCNKNENDKSAKRQIISIIETQSERGIVHITECVDIHALHLSTKNLYYAYPHQLLCGYHNSLSRKLTHMTRMND